MTYQALRVLSLVLSLLPQFVHRLLVTVFGDLIFHCLAGRRRIILSNLDHAFPGRPREWYRWIGRQSCRQVVETSVLSFVLPHFSPTRLRRIVEFDSDSSHGLRDLLAGSQPVVFALPHLGGWELGSCLPLLIPNEGRKMGCIYRPLDHPKADEWVRTSRERFGIKMMSRRSGLAEASRLLRGGGAFFILFDQAAPATGQLSLLLDRLCLSTPLPGLLVKKFGARLNTFVARRLSFWRYRIESRPLEVPPDAEAITQMLDDWLSDLLRHDEQACASWLWGHHRWKLRLPPETLFRLEHRRSNLLATRTLPRTTRFFIQLPDQLRAALWALPLVRALRSSRADACVTVVVAPEFAEIFANSDLVEGMVIANRSAPRRTIPRDLYDLFPDYWISLDDSGRFDVLAKAARCPERLGLEHPGRRRKHLNHPWTIPAGLDDATTHRFRVFEAFFRNFGLEGEIDPGPVWFRDNGAPAGNGPVLLAAQATNAATHGGWPADHWEQLVADITGSPDLPGVALRNIRSGPARASLLPEDLSWVGAARIISACRMVVTDDLDLLHLAGASNVPAVGLFGPANPLREGPLFAAPAWVLQPPGCPETGGSPLRDLRPGVVLDQVRAGLGIRTEH